MFVQPVIGYRAWTVSSGTYDLRSPIVHREAWPTDREITAFCAEPLVEAKRKSEPHESPSLGCSCGLYAWHEPDEALTYHSAHSLAMVGAVLAWGKFVVAPRGFKMQYMRPLALVDHFEEGTRPLGWSTLLEQVIERYQIPLLPASILQEYAETWGEPMGINFTQ